MTHVIGLRLFNWRRFRGEHELALGPGIYALVAQDERDPRRSNWIGKSDLLASIRWCLRGKKGVVEDAETLDDLVSHGEPEMAVEIELSDGTFVSRKRRRGHDKRDLVVEGPAGSHAGDGAQEEIERVLGASEDDQESTCWSLQGQLARLVEARPSELTGTVEGWLRLERLVEAGDHVDQEFASIGKRLRGELEYLQKLEVDGDAARIAELEGLVAELSVEEDAARTAAEVFAAEWQGWLSRVELTARLANRDRLSEELRRAQSIVHGAPADLLALERILRERSSALDVVIAERSRLQRLASGSFDGACPVSPGFRCPAQDAINGRRVENLRAKDAAEKASLLAADAHAKALEPVRSAREAARVAEQHRGRVAELERQVYGATKQVEQLAGVLPVLEGDLPPQKPAPFQRGEELYGLRAELTRRRTALAGVQETRERVAELKGSLVVARAAARVLGQEGARRRVSERAVASIRQEAQRVLVESGAELGVREAWGRETGKLADHCHECGAAYPASARVRQCECGAQRGARVRHEFRWRITRRSGAAKDLAGLALRCGAHRWLAGQRGGGLSLALIDEPLSQLDAAHREQVGRHLARMIGGVFEQAIVADHHQGFMDALPRKILVTGQGDWSRVEVVG